MLRRRIHAFTVAAPIALGAGCSSPSSPSCAISIPQDQLSKSIGMAGGSFSVPVEAPSSCTWQATVSADFLSLTSGSTGKGNATVQVMVASNSSTERTASLQIGDTKVYVSQEGPEGPGPRTPAGCTYAVSPPSASVGAAGGTVSIQVQTEADCPWAAATGDSFLTISSGIVGEGPGTVVLALSANSGTGRTGSAAIAGNTVLIAQAAAGAPLPPPPAASTCTYTVSPTSASIPGNGGSATLNVTAPAGCQWSVTIPFNPFYAIASGASGSGNGTVTITAPDNPNLGTRSSTITIAGRTVLISQQTPCPFTISPSSTSVPAAGGSVTFNVSTPNPACSWVASVPSQNAQYITLNASGPFTGNGSVTATVAPYSGVNNRSLTLSVANSNVSISQPTPCPWSVSPTSFTLGSGGDSVTVNLTTSGTGCSWSATTPSPQWVTFTSPTSGTGSGSVTAEIAPNTEAARAITFTAANQTIVITQAAGANCVSSFNFGATVLFDLTGGTKTAPVSATGSCSWTVSGGDGFVSVVSGGSGTGSGQVTYSVAPNTTGTPRQTKLVAPGKSFTIRQSGPAPANSTFMSYSSAAGDSVGAGQAYLYLFGDATWNASVTSDHNRVSIYLSTEGGSSWDVRFSAPNGQPLVPGTYEDARRLPFQPAGSPGLSFSGGFGCNTLTGRFVVHEAVYGTGMVLQRFHATFEQHCDGAAPALTGEVRVLADPWR